MLNINQRYKINFDKVANRLVFWQFSDKYHILFVQSLLYPLQAINDRFDKWAYEKSIEANMTSQVFYLEWFLNRKFKKHFSNPDDMISLQDTGVNGTPIFKEDDIGAEHYVVRKESEGHEDLSPLYLSQEKEGKHSYSFIVYVPKVDKISQRELNDAISYWVDKYKVVGKTYKIEVDSK